MDVEAFIFHLLIHQGPVHLALDVSLHVLLLYPLLPGPNDNLLQRSAIRVKASPHHSPTQGLPALPAVPGPALHGEFAQQGAAQLHQLWWTQ